MRPTLPPEERRECLPDPRDRGGYAQIYAQALAPGGGEKTDGGKEGRILSSDSGAAGSREESRDRAQDAGRDEGEDRTPDPVCHLRRRTAPAGAGGADTKMGAGGPGNISWILHRPGGAPAGGRCVPVPISKGRPRNGGAGGDGLRRACSGGAEQGDC